MRLNRRRFLRAAGVSLALPWLDALAPSRGLAAGAAPPRRMVCVCAPLGLHPPYFSPGKTGKDYPLTPYLEVLREFRDDFTVISGLSHPEVGPSHDSIYSFLTAAPHPERRAGFRNSVSLDQLAAERIGGATRFPSLALSCEGFSLSWTRSGALVPSDCWPSSVFARLFLEGRPEEVRAQARRLRDGQSVLDTVRDQARQMQSGLGAGDREKLEMQSGLGAGDREKLDEYFTSVRELEQRMARSEEWSRKPKPRVDARPPQDNTNPTDLVGKARLMFDLIHLALQTDSTRLVTLLLLGTSGVPPVAGVTLGHHDLSHHGKDPGKIEQLKRIELEEMKTLRDFLARLKQTREGGANLLDRTMVFFSSNLGNASTHGVKNLPVLLGGGGFKHGRHLAFNPDKPTPLCNLFVSMLRRLGIEADQFGSSSGTLTGLEAAG
jgi:hypothetical protein